MDKKTFLVEIEIEDEDFCSMDLEEAVIDGLENVGNYTTERVNVSEI